jgi:hypothetical protein
MSREGWFDLNEGMTLSLLKPYLIALDFEFKKDAEDALDWCFAGYRGHRLSEMPKLWNKTHGDIFKVSGNFGVSIVKCLKYWKENVKDKENENGRRKQSPLKQEGKQ